MVLLLLLYMVLGIMLNVNNVSGIWLLVYIIYCVYI